MATSGLLADPAPHLRSETVVDPRPDETGTTRPSRMRGVAEGIAALVAAGGLVWVERHGAGRDGWSLTLGLLSVLPMLLVVRAWRLPVWALGAAASVPAGVVAVAVLAPGGAAGVERAGGYGYGAALCVAVAAFARTPGRRLAVAGAALLVVLDQFTVSWLPWWGSEDPSSLMVGTFYWHNQFGAFCLGGAALGLGVALLEQGRARWLGVLVAAFAGLGVMLSGSRASLFALGASCVLAWLVALRAKGLVSATTRLLQVAATTLAVGAFLVSPVFFPRWGEPWGPVANRLGDGSLDANTTARWEFWVAAWRIFQDHPITGPGLETYGELSRGHVPVGIGLSADPHNELARGFAEGGLLSGLPLLVALAGMAYVALRSLPSVWSGRDVAGDPARWAALLATGALVAHALVDFDWSYPALTALAGIMFGLAVAPLTRDSRRSGRRAVGGLLIAAVVTSSLGGALLQRHADQALITPSTSDDRGAWLAWAPDHRLPMSVLGSEVAAGSAGTALADWARDALRDRATVDPKATFLVARSLVAAGRADEGLALALDAARAGGERSTPYVLQYAELLALSGRETEAAELAARVVARQAAQAMEGLGNREAAVAVALPLAAASPEALACVKAVAADVENGEAGSGKPACVRFAGGELLP